MINDIYERVATNFSPIGRISSELSAIIEIHQESPLNF